jgi:hypothetical protein
VAINGKELCIVLAQKGMNPVPLKSIKKAMYRFGTKRHEPSAVKIIKKSYVSFWHKKA